MDLSIIIVSYNTSDLVGTCLTSVTAADDVSKEVFVIDNASTDGSAALIRKDFPSVSLTVNTENRGFAAASNQVLPQCRGRYIFFLNPDTEVVSGAFRESVSYMDAMPHVGLAGTKLVNPDGTRHESVSYRYPGQEHTGLELSSLKGSIACVQGSSMIVRSDVMKVVGGFDEDFFLYGEDQDLCLRIRKSGFEIGYIEAAIIVHLGGQSERRTPLTELWQKKTKAELLFYDKHYLPESIARIRRVNSLQARWRIASLNLMIPFLKDTAEAEAKLIKYRVASKAMRYEHLHFTKVFPIEKKVNDPINVDIIISTYKRYDLLRQALESIVKQSYQHWKCWICEDGESKETFEALEPFLKDNRFRYLPGIHVGFPAVPRNRGIRRGVAQLITCLDDDDLWLPQKLEYQVDFLKSHPYCVLLGCNAFRWKGTGTWDKSQLYFKKNTLGKMDFTTLLNQDYIVHSSVMFRRSAVEKSGLYNEKLTPPIGEDYELWLRIGALGDVWVLPEPYVVYRQTPLTFYSKLSRHENYRAMANIFETALKGVDGVSSPLSYPENEQLAAACRRERDFYLSGPRFLGRFRHEMPSKIKRFFDLSQKE